MASPRYTWNLPPEQAEEPKHVMTAKEKRENFWFYHKWHIIGGAFALFLVGSFIWELATQVHPDYTLAVLTTEGVPTGASDKLSEVLTPFFDDRNGDGEVVVSVMEYTIPSDPEAVTDPNVQMANITKFSGDIDTGESILFLTNDLPYYQEQYGIFAYNDGTTPEEGVEPDYTRMGVRWEDCPALTGLALGEIEIYDGAVTYDLQAWLEDYVLVPRILTGSKLENDEKDVDYYQRSLAVFQTLTQQ